MTRKSDITYARVREILDYDPETGACVWKIRMGQRGKIGKQVGHVNFHGYLRTKINRTSYMVHRLIFLWMTGEWPCHEVDHKDLNRTNNRWVNLRDATDSQNKANSKLQSNNTSGYKGVRWIEARKKYMSYFRKKPVGYFDDPKEAHEAYMEMARRHFGEFARAE